MRSEVFPEDFAGAWSRHTFSDAAVLMAGGGSVAYESQLRSDRAQLHRRLAAAIENRGAAEENAALTAEHLEAAGELHAAFS